VRTPARMVFLLFYLSLMALLFAGCNRIKLSSTWLDRPVYIDGMQFDWEGVLVNLDEQKLNLGVMNDNNFLYICLVPLDETIAMQAMGLGLTVWLEPDGDKRRKLGIHYPVGFQPDKFDTNNFEFRFDGQHDFRERMPRPEEFLDQFQIIRQDEEDTIALPVTNASGVEVRVGTRNDRLVYELKVPLTKSSEHPYAIQTAPGEEIKAEIETGKFKRPSRSRPRHTGGTMPPGGIGEPGGMGGLPPGGGRGGFPGNRPEMPEPLKLKLDIKLARFEPNKD
jgi:hypothetical protein